jgi:hypothetical protein
MMVMHRANTLLTFFSSVAAVLCVLTSVTGDWWL